MTVKLSTTINNIERDVISLENKQLILQFFKFMKNAGTSEKYQNNSLKTITAFSKFLGTSTSLLEIGSKQQIVCFLDTKIKTVEQDRDRSIYQQSFLWCIFFRLEYTMK